MRAVLLFAFDVPDEEPIPDVVERINTVLMHTMGSVERFGYRPPASVAVAVEETAESILGLLEI